MIVYEVGELLDKADALLRKEIQNITENANKKERLLKIRKEIQEALTLLIGG